MKFKSTPHPDAIHFISQGSNQFGHSDIKFLGWFKSEGPTHKNFFTFKGGRFVLCLPFDGDGSKDPDGGRGGDPVNTPEPGSSALLLVGLLGVGAFVLRRNSSLVGAQ
jgi:hypothetical protein